MLRALLVFAGSLILVAAIVVFFIWRWYEQGQAPANRNQIETQLFTIDRGQTVGQIAINLKDEGLIQNPAVFKWYVRIGDHYSQFQAGNFQLSPAMTVAEVVAVLKRGQATNNEIIILPDQRLDQIEASLVSQGFPKAVIAAALKADKYLDHPVAQYWPKDNQSLEGYLYPETFYVTSFGQADAESLIRRSLNQFSRLLNDDPRLLAGFADQGLTVHEAVILASIVDQEVDNFEDQRRVAQVFLKRLRRGAGLGSDVVFFYAVAVLDTPLDFSIDHPYNGRLRPGLPPTPIGNTRLESLLAVADPAPTDYYFFLAGDDGTIHFNKTYADHLRDRDRYCDELCRLPATID